MDINNRQRLSVIALKYLPAIGALIMMIHVLRALIGINTIFADWTFSLPIFPCVVCMLWSSAFKFCYIHRLFIAYICLVSYSIKYESIFGFGHLLTGVRIALLIIGVIIFTLFIIHRNKCDENNKYNKKTA